MHITVRIIIVFLQIIIQKLFTTASFKMLTFLTVTPQSSIKRRAGLHRESTCAWYCYYIAIIVLFIEQGLFRTT